jgi:hypothetical protein
MNSRSNIREVTDITARRATLLCSSKEIHAPALRLRRGQRFVTLWLGVVYCRLVVLALRCM